MDADRVLVAEGLADGVDRGERDLRRVEGVHSEPRGSAGVCGPSDVPDGLHDAAVVGRGHSGLAVLGPRGRVDHHREIHVVEVTETQQLRLAAEELELARAGLAHAPLDVAVLLGGHREEDESPGEMSGGPCVHQSHGRAQQAGDLGIVATRVGGTRRWISVGMSDDDERVELAEEGERGPVAGAPGQIRAHAGDGEAAPRRETELAQRLLDEPRGLELLEAELGMPADLLPEADDLVPPPVDRLPDVALEVVSHHVWSLVRKRSPWP